MSTRPRWLSEARVTPVSRDTTTSAAAPVAKRTATDPGAPKRPSPTLAAQVRSTRTRFEDRAQAARRRPRRLLVAVTVLVVLVAAVVWLVGWSPVLTTRQVTVTGLADPVERSAVEAAAGVALGVPLVRFDTAAASARVARIPTVDSVTVSRSWPATVTVEVRRRVAVLGVKNPQGQLQVVDATGLAFETVSALPAGIALVNATSSAPDPEGLRTAIGVLQLLSAEQRALVTGVTVSSADLVTFQLGAVKVVWGGGSDGAKKLAVLAALLPTTPAVIDVSAPDTPVTR